MAGLGPVCFNRKSKAVRRYKGSGGGRREEAREENVCAEILQSKICL